MRHSPFQDVRVGFSLHSVLCSWPDVNGTCTREHSDPAYSTLRVDALGAQPIFLVLAFADFAVDRISPPLTGKSDLVNTVSVQKWLAGCDTPSKPRHAFSATA
jgi:hypothetical protein